MMSTRALTVFMICLAASAAFVSGLGLMGVEDRHLGAEEQIEQTEEELQDVGPDDEERSIEGFVSIIFGSMGVVRDIASMVFFLTQVLHNLGLPLSAAIFVTAPLYAVVGIAVLEFMRGDRLR